MGWMGSHGNRVREGRAGAGRLGEAGSGTRDRPSVPVCLQAGFFLGDFIDRILNPLILRMFGEYIVWSYRIGCTRRGGRSRRHGFDRDVVGFRGGGRLQVGAWVDG